jgi:hypothetical protein
LVVAFFFETITHKRRKTKKKMNQKIKIFLLCPIPEEQKPIVEYIQLKENETITVFLTFFFSIFSIFFKNRRIKGKAGRKNISVVFLFLFVSSIFFLFFFLKVQNLFFNYFLFILIESIFFLFFITFFRWKKVENDLLKANIEYEESSWYDTQIWEKPFSLLKNDNLLTTQRIQPIIQKMFLVFLFFFPFLFIISFFLFFSFL